MLNLVRAVSCHAAERNLLIVLPAESNICSAKRWPRDSSTVSADTCDITHPPPARLLGMAVASARAFVSLPTAAGQPSA